MQVLAADVDLVVIVRREVERRVPNEPVFQLRRRSVFLVGPHFDVPHLAPALVIADDDTADGAGAGGGRPDDVRIHRIRRRKPALATANRMPHAARDGAATAAAAAASTLAESAVARPAVRRTILLVRVQVVRNLVVDRHVIQLRVRETLLEPGPPARLRDRDALIVADDHPVRVRRIDPHVVMIAAGCLLTLLRDERRASVDRFAERCVQVVRLIVVVRRNGHSRVVRRPAHRIAIGVDHPPVVAAIVRSPELATFGVLALPGYAVAGLDQRIDAARIRLGDRRHHLAHRLGRQPVPSELLPCHAAVARHEQPAARAAALASPGVDLELPHPGEEDARIARIHRDLRAAGVLVHEERALPRRAAVGRPEYAALRLRAVRGAQRACEDDLRVRGIDDDTPDAARLLQTHAGPGLACVRRLVDAVANRDVTANPRLARARPHDVRIGRRDGKRADGLHRLVVEDLLPMHARVGRFRDAAGRATGVVHERVAGDADDRRDPVALWSNEAPAHPTVDIGTGPRGLTLRDQSAAERQECDDDEKQLLHDANSRRLTEAVCTTP